MGRAASRASSELSTPGRLCRWGAAPHRTDLYWVFRGGCEYPPVEGIASHRWDPQGREMGRREAICTPPAFSCAAWG
jgi:hypothetical protein